MNLYTYLLFTLFFPPVAFYKPYPTFINYFTIHGVWPERVDGSYPEYCNRSEPFNQTRIKDLKPILKRIWFDDLHRDPDIFWKHEWEKHGTCSQDILPTERSYFIQAIKWFDEFPIVKILDMNNIKFNNSYYKLLDIETCFNRSVRIMCEKDLISGIELCFDKRLNNMNCLRNSTCPDRIYLRSFKKN